MLSGKGRRPRWPRAGAMAFLATLSLLLLIPPRPDVAPVAGMQAYRNGESVASATPVVAGERPHDPLDGDPPSSTLAGADPLDGELDRNGGSEERDPDPPTRLTRLEIERSGRPNSAPRSDVAYDEDAATVWAPEPGVESSWLWFDVGDGKRLREVRWLISGEGTVEIAVSLDRERWKTVGSSVVESGWGGSVLREDARYLRLSISTFAGEAPPEVAEVAIYGRSDESIRLAQDAKEREKRERGGGRRGEKETPSTREAAQDSGGQSTTERVNREDASTSRGVSISTRKGETRCRGDRARCRAREGKVSVEEDCASSGSCTIDVRADGGTAVCDATGGEKNRAGEGEGRRVGGGGRCEAVANGGTVTIGDINP